MAISVHLVELEKLLRLPRSGDAAWILDDIANNPWFAEQADARLQEERAKGGAAEAPSTLVEAVQRLVNGEPLVTEAAAREAYRAACWSFGVDPSGGRFAGQFHTPCQEIDRCLREGGARLQLSALLGRGAVIDLPEMASPNFGWWSIEEAHAHLRLLWDLERRHLSDNLLSADLHEIWIWLEDATETEGHLLVGFNNPPVARGVR